MIEYFVTMDLNRVQKQNANRKTGQKGQIVGFNSSSNIFKDKSHYW